VRLHPDKTRGSSNFQLGATALTSDVYFRWQDLFAPLVPCPLLGRFGSTASHAQGCEFVNARDKAEPLSFDFKFTLHAHLKLNIVDKYVDKPEILMHNDKELEDAQLSWHYNDN
jgi:hypothetical protein